MKDLQLTPQERGLKEKIKQFIQDNLFQNKLDTRPYRKMWWDNNKPEYSDFIFDNYEKYNKIFPMKIKDFIEFFFFNKEGIFFENFEDFFNNTKVTRLTNILGIGKAKPATGPLLEYVKAGLPYFENQLNFKTSNISELKYCIDNNIKDRPKCKSPVCNNEVSFGQSYNNGFRDYCSNKCQMHENNKIKIAKKSNLSDDEIREIIGKVPLDVRNMTKVEIANNIGNINEYVDKIQTNLPVKERIYIFMNKLTLVDIICPVCGDKKNFGSQGVGYRKTCKNISCKMTMREGDVYKFDSGFLYLLYSKKLKAYKIGIAQQPIRRLRELQKHINDLEFFDCIFIKKDLVRIEQDLHKIFQHRKLESAKNFPGHTEFFKLSKDDIIIFDNIVQKEKYGNI